MSSSLILQRFSERIKKPEVHTNPQEFLGLHYKIVLEFWERIEKLTQEQLEVVNERYEVFRNENYSEWAKAAELTWDASEEVVSLLYANGAGWAAYDVTYSSAAYYTSLELIGGVENPTFLPMFDNL